MAKNGRQKSYRKKRFFVFIEIGVALILAGLIIFQYHFEIGFFALEIYRNYFFTCNTAFLPDFVLETRKTLCIRDYFFDSHFIREGITITVLLSSGIGMIIYAPYQYLKDRR